MDLQKVAAVEQWPAPKNLKSERVFGSNWILPQVYIQLWKDGKAAYAVIEEGQL